MICMYGVDDLHCGFSGADKPVQVASLCLEPEKDALAFESTQDGKLELGVYDLTPPSVTI